jgi:two-component system alkaline phosphatase synthesis response regulator PhoP
MFGETEAERDSILIVEDEALLLRLFKTVVEYILPNHEIVEANGGAAAIQHLQKEAAPRVMVLDLAMPYVDGNMVLEYMADDPRFKDTRVIIVTAASNRLQKEFRDRVDTILTKPVTPRDLEREIQRCLLPA